MEILKQKKATLLQALATLERAVSKHAQSKSYEPERFEEYRDSLIQRFEYCTDLLWKFVKEYLEEVEGIKVASPKPVFRACCQAGILTEDEAEAFLLMLDARNMTSHIYRSAIADVLYGQIPQFYARMDCLVKRLDTR